MNAFLHWWQHLSWSQAAFWVCVFCLIPWSTWLMLQFFTHDDSFRGSHEGQFSNSSRRDYVSRRGLK